MLPSQCTNQQYVKKAKRHASKHQYELVRHDMVWSVAHESTHSNNGETERQSSFHEGTITLCNSRIALFASQCSVAEDS